MGVTAQAVSKWEHDLSCPDVTAVPRLAELFGISTDELLGVPRTAEEPRKSHVGEVVEEVIQDADESGFHLNLQDSGIWFALFLILTGVTYIARNLLGTGCMALVCGLALCPPVPGPVFLHFPPFGFRAWGQCSGPVLPAGEFGRHPLSHHLASGSGAAADSLGHFHGV